MYRNMDVRQQMAHHAKKKERCQAPKGRAGFSCPRPSHVSGDKDVEDVPPVFGSMFGGGKETRHAPSFGKNSRKELVLSHVSRDSACVSPMV